MFFIGNVSADPGPGPGAGPYGDGHGMKHHGGQGMHHQGSGKGGGYGHGPHIFGTPWKESLTKEQALQIDKLHLKLQKEKSVIKAKIKVAKMEMAVLLIEDKPNQSKIDKKVKEIVDLKQQKMTLHNAHVIDMRKVLTEEQRVSFDMMVLAKAKDGRKGHKGH
jgi:Spy/CpxP family protein refolding chaperone